VRIRDVRPGNRPARKGFDCLVRFNIEPRDGIVIYDLTLQRAPDGRLFLYAPMREGAPTANFAPDVRRQIIDIAMDAFEDANAQNAV
jgi:hypothetical protein